MTQSKIRKVDDDEDYASFIDIEYSDDESDGGVYPRIKQEAIQVEDVPEDDDDDNSPSLAKWDSVSPMASLVRGKRVRVPRRMLIPTMKGGNHDEVMYKEVGFPQVKSIRVECEMDCIKNHFSGAGYSTKGGDINLQFGDDAPPPPEIT